MQVQVTNENLYFSKSVVKRGFHPIHTIKDSFNYCADVYVLETFWEIQCPLDNFHPSYKSIYSYLFLNNTS